MSPTQHDSLINLEYTNQTAKYKHFKIIIKYLKLYVGNSKSKKLLNSEYSQLYYGLFEITVYLNCAAICLSSSYIILDCNISTGNLPTFWRC